MKKSMQSLVILRSFLQGRWQWASTGHFVFLFLLLLTLSYRSYHIIVELLCIFCPLSVISYFVLVLHFKEQNLGEDLTWTVSVPILFGHRTKCLSIAVIEEMPIYFHVHDQTEYFKIKSNSAPSMYSWNWSSSQLGVFKLQGRSGQCIPFTILQIARNRRRGNFRFVTTCGKCSLCCFQFGKSNFALQYVFHLTTFCKTLSVYLPEAYCSIFTLSVVVTFCHH